MHCASCHGIDGKGTVASTAEPAGRPADLTRISARREGVWPILEVMSIVDGYSKRVDPRPGMPIIPEIIEGPLIDFDTGNGLVATARVDVLAVAKYLESLQVPPPTRFVP